MARLAGVAALIAWTLIPAAALMSQQAASSAPARAARITEAALVDSLEAAELRFFHQWSRAWRASELSRHPVVGQFVTPQVGTSWQRIGSGAVTPNAPDKIYQRVREENLACHADAKGLWRSRHSIGSRIGPYAVCPTWMLGPPETADEGISIDNALNPEHRQPMAAARAALTASFLAASAQYPRNDWIAGQTVRLLVDARAFGAARSAAAACAATQWWCEALSGYVLVASGNVVAAESAFHAALQHMPRDARCRWTDAGVLLDSLASAAYTTLPCEQRDAVNRTLWWLADPLYSVAGNARLVEHYARHVRVALRSALDRDERYDWRPALGGGALAEMIIRYGWPSYTFWGGEADERGINSNASDQRTGFRKTLTTFEYSAGRVNLMPSWNAVQQPLSATAADWSVRDPSPPSAPNESAWWPREHAPIPVAQLGETQTAMLRRQNGVHYASAADLDSAFAQRAGGTMTSRSTVRGALVMTNGPDSIELIAQDTARVGSTLVLRGTAKPRPALLGVELAGDTTIGAATVRTRFGVNPPAALATLGRGEVAISEPVVLRAPPDDTALPLEADSALAHMLGSTRLARGTKICVYWEIYGFQPADSVTVAVWIERYTQQPFMRQLGIAFKVATDLNTPVANTWDEVALNTGTRMITGAVPIITRSVVLDLSKLPKGDYWLEVAVGKRGEPPVRARRSVTIQ